MANQELAVGSPRRAKTINIGKGSQAIEYAKVSARVAEFHKTHKNGSIRTSRELKDGWGIFEAIIIPDVKNPERTFNGTSFGKLAGIKALEKLETIAVGRGLAFAGFLSDGEIASIEEMANYEETITILEDTEVIDAVAELESAHNLDELSKVWRGFSQARRDNLSILNKKN